MPPHESESIRTALLVAIGASVGGGLIFTLVSAAGWLGLTLSVPLVIVVAVVTGVTAGIISSRRKTTVDEFKLRRPT